MKRELFVREKDLTKAIKIVNDITKKGVIVSNCGWAKAKDLYFLIFKCSTGNYIKICEETKKNSIELYPETVGYTGYYREV